MGGGIILFLSRTWIVHNIPPLAPRSALSDAESIMNEFSFQYRISLPPERALRFSLRARAIMDPTFLTNILLNALQILLKQK